MVEIALRQRTQSAPVEPTVQPRPDTDRGHRPHETPPPPMTSGWVRAAARVESVAMLGALAVALGSAATAYRATLHDARPIAGVTIAGFEVGGLDATSLHAVATAAAQVTLDRPLQLVVGEVEQVTTARTLGALADPEVALEQVADIGRTGAPLGDLQVRLHAQRHGIDVPIGYSFDDARALAALMDIAPAVDRPSLPTRLDLERRKVEPARLGAALLPHDALSAVAIGLASGATSIDLPVQMKPPVADDPLAKYADLDISTVIGSFDTPYNLDAKEADRAFNLKVGATKLTGFVLAPGETFSFNDVVGPRTPENGFRYGGGITGGELVDVLGGGICQISSTVYGAAFFAGLDILENRPHSRPSSYVDMGLDATVVWPDVDLRLRNPFDFPVVIHMVVRSGKVHAEILGARRPYQVAFERQLVEAIPYGTIWRNDGVLRSGSKVVSQRGMRGFKVKRTRKIYQAGDLVREESRELSYPPTSEIVRQGTNPAGAMPENKPTSPLRDPAPHLRIVQ
jgi:vancomycin resistance protein YoaR